MTQDCVLFNGKVVIDDATMAELGVKNGSTFRVTSHLRGGMLQTLPQKIVSVLDKGHKITRASWYALFNVLDTDSDGYVSRKEWCTAGGETAFRRHQARGQL